MCSFNHFSNNKIRLKKWSMNLSHVKGIDEWTFKPVWCEIEPQNTDLFNYVRGGPICIECQHLGKQSGPRWFETLSRSLSRHCNDDTTLQHILIYVVGPENGLLSDDIKPLTEKQRCLVNWASRNKSLWKFNQNTTSSIKRNAASIR